MNYIVLFAEDLHDTARTLLGLRERRLRLDTQILEVEKRQIQLQMSQLKL